VFGPVGYDSVSRLELTRNSTLRKSKTRQQDYSDPDTAYDGAAKVTVGTDGGWEKHNGQERKIHGACNIAPALACSYGVFASFKEGGSSRLHCSSRLGAGRYFRGVAIPVRRKQSDDALEEIFIHRPISRPTIGRTARWRYYGRIANARAGNPKPFSTFGHVTTITAPVAGTLSRLAIASIWK
jgi:hypothetical protein